jgi:hypothetical protein
MKKTGFLFLTLATICCACHDQPAPLEKQPAAKAEKKNFFPVADYLKSEINDVDSLPVGILKYHTVQGKTDSAYIHLDEFHRLAGEFLPAELTDSVFSTLFSESSFMDQTTQAVTFTYEPLQGTRELRRVDVLASPGASTDKVKSIYMEKTINRGDTTVIEKMFWKAKRSFRIISIAQKNDQQPVTSELKVVWDDRD